MLTGPAALGRSSQVLALVVVPLAGLLALAVAVVLRRDRGRVGDPSGRGAPDGGAPEHVTLR